MDSEHFALGAPRAPDPRKHFALGGAPGAPDFRIELDLLPNAPALDQLHDDGVGNSARVYGGHLRVRGSLIPVAVKVQRDKAIGMLAGEPHATVAAKFTREQVAHLRLQREAEPGSELPFPRLYPLSVEEGRADELPPSFLCRHAAGALAPRCPQETCRGTALQLPTDRDDPADPGLRCPKCGVLYRVLYTGPEQERALKERIFRATLGADTACGDCPHKSAAPGACQPFAVPLNFSPTRVLVSERLDLDLSDFLGRLAGGAPGRRNPAWERYSAQSAALHDPLAWLGAVGDLSEQLLTAVRALHAGSVAHVDLKPENVCLRLGPGAIALKVIDLGLAEDQLAEALFRQAAGPTKLQTEFAAPEVRFPQVKVTCEAVGPGAPGTVTVSVQVPRTLVTNQQDPPVARGDCVDFGNGIDARVLDVRPGALSSDPWVLVLERDRLPAFPPGTPVTVYKIVDRAADIYSFGVILIALLLREAHLPEMRRAVEALDAVTKSVADPGGRPARALTALVDGASAAGPLRQSLSWYGELRPLAEELFGIAILCVVRAPGFYTEGRGDGTQKALDRLATDLGRAAHAVRVAADQTRAAQLRADLIHRIDEWRGPPAPAPKAPAPAPKPSVQRVLEALLFAGAGADANERELTLLRQNQAPDLSEALLAARNRLDPAPPEPAPLKPTEPAITLPKVPPPPPGVGAELLVFLRYAVPFDRDTATQDRFLAERARLARSDGAPRWVGRHHSFADLVQKVRKEADVIDRFVGGTDAVFLAPLARARELDQALRGRVELGPEVFHLFDPEPVLVAADRLEAVADRVHEEWLPGLLDKWESALKEWRRSANPLRGPLAALEGRSRRHLEETRAEHDGWYENTRSALESVRTYARGLQRSLFPDWAEARGSRGWLFGRNLDRFTIDADLLALRSNEYGEPVTAAEGLLSELLGPYGAVTAALALAELQGLGD